MRYIFIKLVAAAILWSSLSMAEDKKVFEFLTNERGSAFFEVTTAIHRVFHEKTGKALSQVPLKGSSESLPRVNRGEADFALSNSLDSGLAFQGESYKIGGKNPFPYSPDIRLVAPGPLLLSGMFARKESQIQSLSDLKGKRVSGEFSAHMALWFNTLGYLIGGNLDWNDIKVVPVKNAAESRKALIEKQVDAASFAVSSNKNADDLVGIKSVGLDCSGTASAKLQKEIPGYQTKMLKAGYGPGIQTDTCVIAYPLYIISHKAASAEMVGLFIKTVYENLETLQKQTAMTKTWEKEIFADAGFTIPYHSAAVEYLKSKGIWSEKMEANQRRFAPKKTQASL